MKTLTTIRVDLGERSYDICIGPGWLGELGASIAKLLPGHRCVIVTHPEIERHWAAAALDSLRAAGLEAEVFTIPEGERAKTLETVSLIYDFLIQRRYERGTVVIALGGGVVGDVSGFAAASFLRGVALAQAPTSLLAMVDSSVGGKTGVNHPSGKNLIGAFKQPCLVGIDLDCLNSLPEAEFRSGLAETVKYGMIADADFFEFQETHAGALLEREADALTHLIARSCEIKADVVSRDERERGLRAILNFGHTFAHAAERLSDYGTLRHGEAVAGGMMAACRLGSIAGDFPDASTRRLGDLLVRLGLPIHLPRFDPQRYLEAMASDKKVQGGEIRFVLPIEIGRVRIGSAVEPEAVTRALEATFEYA